MFQRKRFRHRSNNRGHQRRPNGNGQMRLRPDSFLNGQRKNNFRSTQSAENFQHADHFMRVVDDKNKNRIQSKVSDKPLQDTKTSSENTKINDDQSIEEKK